MADDRPTIAHVLHRLDRAGAEVLAAGLARELRDRFNFVFLCLDGLGPLADELRGDGFIVEALDRKPGIDLQLGKRLHQRLRVHHVALVHAHQYTPFFYSALSRGRMPGRRKHSNPPILFTEHGRHYPDHRSTRRVLANKLLLKNKDRVTAVGQFVRDALIKNEGIAPHRINIIYNGIAPAPGSKHAPGSSHTLVSVDAHDKAAARKQAREKLGIDHDRPVAMQIARFHPVKDHATALRAWAKVVDIYADALLVFVGEGDQRAAMQTLAGELNIQDNIRFTGPVQDARALIPAADLCMLTSLSEGVSVTLLEAMAAGKPVVATDVGGNSEVVENYKTGRLAPRGDAQAIADCIIDLIKNPTLAEQYGKAGRQKLLDHFTADRMHAEYARMYESMGRFS